MAFYQMDSSALVKRYLREPGSAFVRTICRPGTQHFVGLVRVTIVEVAGALARKHREGDISRQERDAALLTQAHPLRAYDAIQVAAALIVHGHLVGDGLPPPIFVSADDRLCAVATAEGLQAVDPKAHP